MASKSVFVRDATGLVKAIGPFAAFLFGAQCISPPSSGFLAYYSLPIDWPGSDIILILTLGMVCCLFHAITYAQIGSTYPRSGADYVFASRTLTPVGAFTSNFALSAFSGLVAGSLVAWIPSTEMSSYFFELGTLTNQSYLLTWSSLLTSGFWGFLVGSVFTLVALGLMLVSPTKTIAYLKYSFYLAIVAWAIILVSLASVDSNTFTSNWNTFMGAGNFAQVIPTAQSHGLTYQYSPVIGSVAGLIMGFWIFYGYQIPTFFAGEVKRASRTLILGSLSSLIFMWALFVGGAVLLERLVSSNWLAAESYLFGVAPGTLPAEPWISFYAAVAQPNLALGAIVFLGFTLSLVGLVVTYFYYVSRNFFSWSFDRLVPAKISEVRPNGAPWVSVVIITLLAEVGLYLSEYTSIIGVQLNFTLFAVLCMMIPVLSAIILPWKNKQAFEQAPAIVNKKIAGVPLISLFGCVTFVYLVWMVYASFAYPAVFPPTSGMVEMFIGTVIVGAALFYVAKYLRAKEGLDLKFIYSSIPPE